MILFIEEVTLGHVSGGVLKIIKAGLSFMPVETTSLFILQLIKGNHI